MSRRPSQKLGTLADLCDQLGDHAGLADARPDFDANGAEWRTPPLWGIGLFTLASVVYGIGMLTAGLGTEWQAWYLGPVFVVSIAGEPW